MKEDTPHEVPQAVDTLGMELEEMRRLGYRVVDKVVDRMARRNEEPAISAETPARLLELLGGPLPEQPLPPDESIDLLADIALLHQQHGDHPRYFARVPGPSSFAGVLGDWLATGFNSIAASWAGGAGTSTVELVVIDWLVQLLGMPADTEGVLVSGGSQGNLTAIAAVVAQRGKGVVYLSDQTHSCVARALTTLGFMGDEICVLPSDDQFRMPMHALRDAVHAARREGRTPLMVIGTAGTTNTGITDPLDEIAALCAQEDIWFHVDGAYGAPAALTCAGRDYLKGMQRADSLVLDPHKWLFQPYDTGCLLIRPGVLEDAFTMDPEYLRDVKAQSNEVDFRNRGLELTRRARALKLWLSLRTYGAARFREAIAGSIELAEYAEELLRNDPECWEVLSPAQIGIVCFALRDASADEHQRRTKALSESGYACVTTTNLKGRTALRLCIINPLTTQADIRETIARLAGDG